jgi:hypothetical protein
MAAVIAERRRHVDVEGWTTEHDDDHVPGELARAGAAYLYSGSLQDPDARARARRWYEKHGHEVPDTIRRLWPWDWRWWKPAEDDCRRDLVRGCSLGIAEGEKFDRARRRRVRAAVEPTAEQVGFVQ